MCASATDQKLKIMSYVGKQNQQSHANHSHITVKHVKVLGM